MNEEEFWRNKIAEQLDAAWEKMVMKELYRGDLLFSMIRDFVKDGNRDTL